ncbi:MAG TPA: SurA N-terminal domain-containing protein [Pyrinomonadaceae bacterium]|nr:SurA N-terminal domain-containing protein [Pyrinomonadaceae bacterium]
MLKQFSRLEKTRSAFIVVFAALMVVSLVFFYAPTRDTATASTAGGREVLASVRGDEVLVADMDDMTRMYRQSFGPQFSLSQLGGGRRVLDGLIRTRLVAQEAERLGLAPSDKEVSDSIVERYTDPATGKFVGFERYKQAIVSQFGDLTRFERGIRDALAEQKLRAFVTAGVQVSDEELQSDYERSNTSFELTYVNVTPAELAKGINPSDEELRSYFASHGEEFRINEPQKKVRYLFIDQTKLAGKLEVTDEELRREFDARKPQAGVRVQQIVLKVADPKLDQQVLQKATELAARARDEKMTATEESFAELARGNSEDPATAKSGGWLPNPVRKSTPAGPNQTTDIYQGVLDMQPGYVSDPVFNKATSAYYILRRGDNVLKTFDEARPELLASLRNSKSYAAAAAVAQRAVDRLRETKDVGRVAQELAAEANMSPAEMVKETPFVKPHDNIPDIGSSPQFEAAIAPLENPQDVGDRVGIKNGFAVPMLVEKRDPRVPEFDEARERVLERVREQKAKEQLEQAAREIASAAGSAEGLKAAAERFGLKVETLPSYRIGTPVGTAGTSLAADEAIYALKPGEVMKAPVKVGESWVVAGALKRTDADLAEFGRQRAELAESALDERRQQVFDDYATTLRARADREGEIEIHDDVLAKVEKQQAPEVAPQRPRIPATVPIAPGE